MEARDKDWGAIRDLVESPGFDGLNTKTVGKSTVVNSTMAVDFWFITQQMMKQMELGVIGGGRDTFETFGQENACSKL